jgi:hypothetical protein
MTPAQIVWAGVMHVPDLPRPSNGQVDGDGIDLCTDRLDVLSSCPGPDRFVADGELAESCEVADLPSRLFSVFGDRPRDS